MPDFAKIKSHCEKRSSISKSIVDEFLLYYAAEKEGLEEKIARQLADYRKIINKMPKEWPGFLMSQLIAHRLFKKGGFASEYLNHAEVRRRSPEELELLQLKIEHPWRYSFCSVQNNPDENFYEMKDVLSEETFLLYSPGLRQTIKDLKGVPNLCFFLIGFNGECFQTFGSLAYFKGIQPFDIFFFAKQLYPDIIFTNEVPAMIEANPLPFAMLWSGGELPITVHKKDMVIFHKSEYFVKELLPEKYEEEFIIEKKHPIFMLSLKRWHTFPHFAKCFYHTKKSRFILTSMTKRGYDSLISALNEQGNDFPLTPEIVATPAMLHIVKDVLNIDVDMAPYEKHFARTVTPTEQKELDRINAFLESLIPRLNKNEDYDISELAKKTGIKISDAQRIAENMIKSISRMPK
jgi:hypothetical protein